MMRSIRHRRGPTDSVGPARNWPFLVWLAPFLLGVGGCSDEGGGEATRRESVSGTVTWKGQPLAEGIINFTSAAGKEASKKDDQEEGLQVVRSDIKDGQYELPNPPGLSPGPYKVRIRAQAAAANAPAGVPDFEPGAKEQIPEKYNDQTTLTAEVVQGSNTFNYELTGTRSASKAKASPRKPPEAARRRGPDS